LILDATCAPQDIRIPTDISLLNEARIKAKELIDTLRREGKKPRTSVANVLCAKYVLSVPLYRHVQVLHEDGKKATTDSYMWAYLTASALSYLFTSLFDSA